jgi:hypothetical protein
LIKLARHKIRNFFKFFETKTKTFKNKIFLHYKLCYASVNKHFSRYSTKQKVKHFNFKIFTSKRKKPEKIINIAKFRSQSLCVFKKKELNKTKQKKGSQMKKLKTALLALFFSLRYPDLKGKQK